MFILGIIFFISLVSVIPITSNLKFNIDNILSSSSLCNVKEAIFRWNSEKSWCDWLYLKLSISMYLQLIGEISSSLSLSCLSWNSLMPLKNDLIFLEKYISFLSMYLLLLLFISLDKKKEEFLHCTLNKTLYRHFVVFFHKFLNQFYYMKGEFYIYRYYI